MALPTKLTLNIVSPDQSISQEVDEVSMPGVEGDFGVLPGKNQGQFVNQPGVYRQRKALFSSLRKDGNLKLHAGFNHSRCIRH